MPLVQRTPNLQLSYAFDDHTDPWEERPFLLLQHGNGRSAAFWYRWIPHLAGRYREVDTVQSHRSAERFGNAAHFQSRWRSRGARTCY